MKSKLLYLLLIIALIGGYFAYRAYQVVYAPNVSGLNEAHYLYIAPNRDWTDLQHELDTILTRPNEFYLLAEYKGLNGKVKSGRYLIENGLSNNTLVNRLRAGIQEPVRLTLNMAYTIPQVAGQAGRALHADSLTILNYLQGPEVRADFGIESQDLLGIFMANTYEFYWNASPKEFVQRMLKESEKFWQSRAELVQKSGLNQWEIITLASIVESETAKADEMPKVAGLYLNRLKRGIKLESDPTVIYAHRIAHPDTSIARVWLKYLSIDSPYNTYKYAGLPPGPIRIPDPRSIDAVLNAEHHSYVFMCADPDRPGYHNFAQSYRQHQINSAKYHRWASRNGIR